MKHSIPTRKRSLSRNLVAGGIAGLAGAFAMSGFTRLWDALISKADDPSKHLPYSQQEWDATTRIAEAAARRLRRHRLNHREKCTGACVVHYMVGATTGIAYALLGRRFPQVRRSSGVLFGIALWLLADELIMPTMRATRKLRDYSVLAQANALGEHIAYAVTADALLRLRVSRILRDSQAARFRREDHSLPPRSERRDLAT
jgi:Protein of unknown function (DUF1440)